MGSLAHLHDSVPTRREQLSQVRGAHPILCVDELWRNDQFSLTIDEVSDTSRAMSGDFDEHYSIPRDPFDAPWGVREFHWVTRIVTSSESAPIFRAAERIR
jgi:hypothetical protein